MGNVLIDEFSVHDVRDVPKPRARVEDFSFEVEFVFTDLLLETWPNANRRLPESLEIQTHGNLWKKGL